MGFLNAESHRMVQKLQSIAHSARNYLRRSDIHGFYRFTDILWLVSFGRATYYMTMCYTPQQPVSRQEADIPVKHFNQSSRFASFKRIFTRFLGGTWILKRPPMPKRGISHSGVNGAYNVLYPSTCFLLEKAVNISCIPLHFACVQPNLSVF